MFSPYLEKYRAREIARLSKSKSFSNPFEVWEPEIRNRTSNLSDADAIFKLGDSLSEIFRLTGGEGRTQSSQSGGGYAWEGLICWYLNLVFAGTRAVALKQTKKMVPSTIFDAATVKYAGKKTNTESDISVVVFPENFRIPNKGPMLDRLDEAIRADLQDTHLRVIQCKTNWNDNAQIPMLWDMVYQGNYPVNSTVRIGTNGVSISKLGSFKYCFVTVPTNKTAYTKDTLAVERVRGMTGGNYWGQASKDSVAEGLSEIFTNEFDFVFPGSVQASINASITEEIGPYGA